MCHRARPVRSLYGISRERQWCGGGAGTDDMIRVAFIGGQHRGAKRTGQPPHRLGQGRGNSSSLSVCEIRPVQTLVASSTGESNTVPTGCEP